MIFLINKQEKQKLLLTGGTGFFGKSIIKYLINNNIKLEKLYILTRDSKSFRVNYPHLILDYIEFIDGDIFSFKEFDKDIDYIIHAATSTNSHSFLNQFEYFKNIEQGTINLLNIAKQHQVKGFLLTSSGAVYGKLSNMVKVNELYNGAPNVDCIDNAYGLAKRTSEYYCFLFNKLYGLRAVIARCFAFIGPSLECSKPYAIVNFIKDAVEKKEITVHSHKNVYRSYMHQDDLVEWLFTLLFDESAAGAYNIGSDKAISIHNLADKVSKLIGGDSSYIKYNDSSDGEMDFYVPDVNKITRQFGVKQKIDLDYAILEYARYLELNECY